MLRGLPGRDHLVNIRHNVHDELDADWLCQSVVRRGISPVVDAGLTFDLLVRARELPAAIDLVRRFPEGRFVLDHMAKPPIASGFSSGRHLQKSLAAETSPETLHQTFR
jgi:L-fuconolactonase